MLCESLDEKKFRLTQFFHFLIKSESKILFALFLQKSLKKRAGARAMTREASQHV